MKAPLAIAALMLVAAVPARAVLLETDPHVYPVSAKHRVRLEFPVGDLRVVPTDEDRVRFELRVRCNGRSEERCEELANRLVLDSHDEGGTLSLKLHKYPKWHSQGMTVIGELRVPRRLALDIEMGVGELDVNGIEGDLDVELGVGDADIRAPKDSAGRVTVEAGVGDARIHGGGTRTMGGGFIGSHASYDGDKRGSSVRLHVGVGDATVRLE